MTDDCSECKHRMITLHIRGGEKCAMLVIVKDYGQYMFLIWDRGRLFAYYSEATLCPYTKIPLYIRYDLIQEELILSTYAE